VAGALFSLLEVQATLKSPGKITVTPNPGGQFLLTI